MRRIIYAGGELVTGDDIAAAVLAYGEALAETARADTVEIPILDANGARATAKILIGPASQIMAVEVRGGGEELRDPETTRRLTEATRALRPEAGPETESPHQTWSDEY